MPPAPSSRTIRNGPSALPGANGANARRSPGGRSSVWSGAGTIEARGVYRPDMGPKDDDPDTQGADLAVAPTWGPGETVSTLAETHGGTGSGAGALAEIPSVAPRLATGTERYVLGDLIGKGGMGEVLLAIDGQIGRDVAVKRM